MSLDLSSKVVIIGGGIGGLFTARYLAHLGFSNITLVEKHPEVGDLLRNSVFETNLSVSNGFEFDLGTHFVLKTGNKEIDDILDLDIGEDFVEFHDSLPEGQYKNGKIYADSGCLNINLFPTPLRGQIFEEITELTVSPVQQKTSLQDALLQKYSKTACENILEPVFEKLTGSETKNLDPTVENTFFPSRVIVAEREKSIELKKENGWDERIAFSNFRDSSSPILKYYPKQGTAQKWVDNLVQSIDKQNVKVIRGVEPSSAESENGKITSLQLSNGETLECDYIYWTIPPIFLARLLKIDVPSKRPNMRSVGILHFVTDSRPIEGPFWINVFDPKFKSYRITLYDNFSKMGRAGVHRVSVEVLHDGTFKAEQYDKAVIFEELKTMGVLPDTAQCLWSAADDIPNGFPIMEPGDIDLYGEQIAKLGKQISNVHMVSRFRGGASGQMAIISNLFAQIDRQTKLSRRLEPVSD